VRRIPTEYKELGISIRRRRKALHLIQNDIADATGTSTSFVSQVERGKLKASDQFLWNLEKALELPEGTLFLKVGRLTMRFISTLKPQLDRTDRQLLDGLVDSLTDNQLRELIAYARFLKLQTQVRELSI